MLIRWKSKDKSASTNQSGNASSSSSSKKKRKGREGGKQNKHQQHTYMHFLCVVWMAYNLTSIHIRIHMYIKIKGIGKLTDSLHI